MIELLGAVVSARSAGDIAPREATLKERGYRMRPWVVDRGGAPARAAALRGVADRVRGLRSRPSDEGFTLIEVIIAMFITVVVMVAMLGLMVSSLETIQQAKQRQTATGLATQALERLRALPYDQVTQPDSAYSTMTGLAHVVPSGSVTYFRPVSVLPGVDELLVVNARSGRFENQTVGNVSYRVSTYVTKPAVTGEQAFFATAIVTWSSSVSNGQRTTAERSVFYSPAGCLSTAQSPFAAPCQSYFTAQSGQTLSGLTLTHLDDPADPNDLPTDPIFGFGAATKLELGFPSENSSLFVEQTASGTATSTTSSASVEAGPLSASQAGASAMASVDSDPSSTPGQSQSATTSAYSSTPVAISGSAGTLRVAPAGSNSGASFAAIAASGSTCVGPTGAPLVTGSAAAARPCAGASMQPLGTSTLTYAPTWGLGNSVTLASVGPSTTVARSVSAQLNASNVDACTTGAGPGTIGCAYAATSRTVGDVVLGDATGAASAPSGLTGIVRVTGLTESARAEEGQGSRDYSYIRDGSLQIWTGTAYAPLVNLSSYATPGVNPTPWTIAPTTVTYGPPLDVTLTYEGTVTVQRPTVQRIPAVRTNVLVSDCKVQACSTQLNGGGVVSINLNVTVKQGATEVGRFALTTSLGGLVAQATYKVASNA